jgi:hypothetical protein
VDPINGFLKKLYIEGGSKKYMQNIDYSRISFHYVTYMEVGNNWKDCLQKEEGWS